MSHPEPSLDKQSRRHRGPLVGIALAVVLAVLAAFLLGAFDVNDDEEPAAATATG